jgi:AcrR family transcriptional regulator
VTTPGLTRRRLSAEQRRECVLSAATENFGTRGYVEASLREIAASAGVTTPVLYDHFASKADLYCAVACRQADLLLECWSSPLTGSPEEMFREIVDRIFGWVDANPQGSRILFADAPSDPLVAETQTALLDRAAGAGARFFAASPTLRHPLELSRQEADAAVARLAMSAVNGLVAWWWHNPKVPRASVTALACDLLWHGLQDLTGTTPHGSGS